MHLGSYPSGLANDGYPIVGSCCGRICREVRNPQPTDVLGLTSQKPQRGSWAVPRTPRTTLFKALYGFYIGL